MPPTGEDLTNFPTRLREMRTRLGMSQEQLARRLGVSFATINRWEGARTRPPAATIARVLELETTHFPSVPTPPTASATPELSNDDAEIGAPVGGSRVEWSHLTPDDRATVARLTLLAPTWTAAEALAVVDIDEHALTSVLDRLVLAGWVEALLHATKGSSPRYELPAWASKSARDDATFVEIARARPRFASRLAEEVASLSARLMGPDQSIVIDRLDALDRPIEETLRWAESGHDGPLGVGMVATLWNWWLIKGRVADGRRWVDTFLTADGATSDLRPYARASLAGGIFAAEQGEYELAWGRAMVARDGFDRLGDRSGVGDACRVLAIVARYRGALDEAEALLERAVATYRDVDDVRGISTALNNLAALAIDGGDLAKGRRLLAETIPIKRSLGDRRSLATGLVNLADLSVRDGAPSEAIEQLAEARTIAEELSDARLSAFVEHNLGDAEVARGDGRASIAHYETALSLFEQGNAARDVTMTLCSLGVALHVTGATARAIEMLRRSEALAASIGDAQRAAEVRVALAACGETPAKVALPGGVTNREADVLGLLASGMSNRQIAERLVLSTSTVERHVANIYRKLNVHSRVEATRFAMRNGLTAT